MKEDTNLQDKLYINYLGSSTKDNIEHTNVLIQDKHKLYDMVVEMNPPKLVSRPQSKCLKSIAFKMVKLSWWRFSGAYDHGG